MKILPICILGWLAAWSSAFAVPGGDPELARWLERMKANMDKAYHTQINGYVSLIQGGHDVKVGMRGRLVYQDARHSRLKMTMDTKINQKPASMELLVVSDGEVVWQEIRSSLMEGAMVEKANIGSDEMASQWLDLTNWSAQLQELEQLRGLHIVENTDRTFTLEGGLDELTLRQLGLTDRPQKEKDAMVYRIVIDKHTAFPISMLKGIPENPVMELKFEDFGFLNRDEIPPDAFGYTPPEDTIKTP